MAKASIFISLKALDCGIVNRLGLFYIANLRPVYTGDFCRSNSMQFLSREVATSNSHM